MTKRKKMIVALTAGLILMLCFVSMAGCGSGNSSQGNEYYEVTAETSEIFPSERYETLLGMQYFQGEPVQLRADRKKNVFLVKTDGARTQLLEGFSNAANTNFYIDDEENLYWWSRDWSASFNEEDDPGLRLHKLDPAGKELWVTELDPGALLRDICQIPGGHVVLLLQNPGGGVRAADVDPETGALGRMDAVMLAPDDYIAAGREGLLVMETGSAEAVSEISPTDGARASSLSFGGGAYSLWADKEQMEIADFRLTDAGEAEILWADPKKGLGVQERLIFTKTDKIPIVMRATFFYSESLKKKIAEFNLNSEKYHVVLEYDNKHQAELGQQTAVQIAAGGGPDILYGYILESLFDLAEKGGFEDLAPYIEASGVDMDDYFPYAFIHWRGDEGIYAVRTSISASSIYFHEAVLGGRDAPKDIGALVDALLAWDGDATIYRYASTEIL